MKGKLRPSTLVAALIVWSLPLVAHARLQSFQTANIHEFPMGMDLGGAATLVRSKHAIELHISTSGLDLNAAYSVWWVVFNNPSACVGGCGLDDLGRPEVRASVLNAAGFVTGFDGTANVDARLEGGEPPLGVVITPAGTVNGLDVSNGFRAEVHFILRSHGMILPGSVAAQISTTSGGCNPTCVDQQSAGFLAVQ
jgi:hypothetical protein